MLILNDFDTSVSKALSEIHSKWRDLPGLIICGTHAPHDVEYMLSEIAKARESGLPFLGICFGHQLAAIQYARDVLGIKDATSEEFSTCPVHTVQVLDEYTTETPVLGGRSECCCGTFIVKKRPEKKVGLHDSESYWSYFDVAIDWEKPINFVTTPYHPEYHSSWKRPHPDLVKFIKLCKKYRKLHEVAA